MTTPDRERFHLEMVLENAQQAMAIVEGKSREEFDADLVLRLALRHMVCLVGEAARATTPEQRASYPHIPWVDIIGMRNIVVHEYFRVDDNIVWKVCTAKLPTLVAQIQAILVEDDPTDET